MHVRNTDTVNGVGSLKEIILRLQELMMVISEDRDF